MIQILGASGRRDNAPPSAESMARGYSSIRVRRTGPRGGFTAAAGVTERHIIEDNIRSDVIRWRISTSKITIAFFLTFALVVFSLQTFRNVDFENVGQDY